MKQLQQQQQKIFNRVWDRLFVIFERYLLRLIVFFESVLFQSIKVYFIRKKAILIYYWYEHKNKTKYDWSDFNFEKRKIDAETINQVLRVMIKELRDYRLLAPEEQEIKFENLLLELNSFLDSQYDINSNRFNN